MHTVEVEVTDGIDPPVRSQPVDVEVLNLLPTADAGVPQTVVQRDVATLSGSGSDPEGLNVTYVWTQTGGPAVALLGSTTTTPSFTAPSLGGTASAVLSFELTVSDPEGGSSSAQTSVTVVKN